MTEPAGHRRRQVLAALGSVAAAGLGGCLGIGGGGTVVLEGSFPSE
jgi:hypothetical protein